MDETERTHCILLFLTAVIGCALMGSVAAWDHVVGSSYGWRIPMNTSQYQEWADTKHFVVGDKLVFLFTTGVQNVWEVSAQDYEYCTQEKVIDMYYAGPTILNLTEAGPRYFYCGLGTHCEAGQKLAINVSATAPPEVDDTPPPAATMPAYENNKSAGSIRYALTIGGVLAYLLHPFFL